MYSALIILLFHASAIAQVSSENVTCPEPPDVPHGFVSEGSRKAEYQHGDIARFTCETGYTSGLPIKYECMRGEWRAINTGHCYLKPCPLPEDTPNGYYEITSGEDLVFGTTIKYFCNEGYQMVSRTTTRTCFLNSWTNRVPLCEPMSCDLPPLDGDKLVVSGLPDSDDPVLPDRFLRFSCKGPRTILAGSSMVICGKNGQWDSPFPTCEEITCRVPPMHRDLGVTGLPPGIETLRIGHTLRFYCNNDKPMDGPEEIQCLESGQWSSQFPTCAENCHVYRLPIHVVAGGNQRLPLIAKPGGKLTFGCSRSELFLEGAQEVECLASGQWSQSFPTCEVPRTCVPPPSLEHGDIQETRQSIYSHGERVEYVCQQYYVMEVRPYKTCRNGKWVGEEIQCFKPCIVDSAVMTPRNIAFRYSWKDKLYVPHNDHVQFRCTRGRPVGSSSMRHKCVDGVMTPPTCS